MTMRKKCPPHEIPTCYKTALSKPHLRGFTEPLTPVAAGKLARLKELAERDAELASKELHYSYSKMSSRLVSQVNVDFCANETYSGEVPAYLRRKSSEGKGRKPWTTLR